MFLGMLSYTTQYLYHQCTHARCMHACAAAAADDHNDVTPPN